MARKYKNIPVKPEIYTQVQLISEFNQLGERGLGAQIELWAARELPECKHKKEVISIEYFGGAEKAVRGGYYCKTCQRVYAKISEADLIEQDGKKLLDAVKVKE